MRSSVPQRALGLGLLSVFAVARMLPIDAVSDSWTICFYKTLTGFPCVFCGLTHAFVLAAHGNLQEATSFNPLWPVAAIGLFIHGAILALGRTMPWPESRRSAIGITLVAVVLAGTALRSLLAI